MHKVLFLWYPYILGCCIFFYTDRLHGSLSGIRLVLLVISYIFLSYFWITFIRFLTLSLYQYLCIHVSHTYNNSYENHSCFLHYEILIWISKFLYTIHWILKLHDRKKLYKFLGVQTFRLLDFYFTKLISYKIVKLS